METIVTESYKSFDGKVFELREACENYEKSYLTDEQLIKCYHFFYENMGDYGKLGARALDMFYDFEVNREHNFQEVTLCRYKDAGERKTDGTIVYKKSDTANKLCIYNDLDFYFTITGSLPIVRVTNNIVKFHEFINALKFSKKPTIPVQKVDENVKVPTLSSELISFAIDNGFEHTTNPMLMSKNIGVVTHSLWIINGEYELSGFNNHEATSIYETGFQPIVLDEAKLLITTFQKSIK